MQTLEGNYSCQKKIERLRLIRAYKARARFFLPFMSSQSLSTIPPEIHYRLLSSLSDFSSLSAAVLTVRPLHAAFDAQRRKVLSSVGRNFLGSLFSDALLLARCQEKRDGVVEAKGLSPSTVRLLVNNADAVGELQTIVFGLLRDENAVE